MVLEGNNKQLNLSMDIVNRITKFSSSLIDHLEDHKNNYSKYVGYFKLNYESKQTYFVGKKVIE